jgi:5'-methylthioadenosine phosphorylase
MEYAEIGIIGGSGFYDLEGLEGAHGVRLKTPFGAPSEKLMLGKLNGRSVAFLSRHGHGHRLSPSEVNYRANLFAMKMLKVEYLFSITAVGSLKEELQPGELVIPDQYVDQTFKREKTFFENGVVAHVPMADPTCPSLADLAFRLAKQAGLAAHLGGTYCNMEGPQFSSRAESLANRQMGHALIGMTQAVVPPPGLCHRLRLLAPERGIGQRGDGHRQPEPGSGADQEAAAADHQGTPGKTRCLSLRQRPGRRYHHRAAVDPGKDI